MASRVGFVVLYMCLVVGLTFSGLVWAADDENIRLEKADGMKVNKIEGEGTFKSATVEAGGLEDASD